MKIRVLPAGHLDADLCADWRSRQWARNDLASPFFAPEFCMAVGQARGNVSVAVIEGAPGCRGFFAFQRDKLGRGQPAGAPLSDYQAVVAAQPLGLSPEELVGSCGLSVWSFDHLLCSQPGFDSYHQRRAEAPVIDLSNGVDAYETGLARQGSSLFRQLRRKSRKCRREVGPVRFEADTRAGEVFESVLKWKAEQFRRTQQFDIFDLGWPVRLLQLLRGVQGSHFAGITSALYIGDCLAAAHIGIRSDSVWHWWLPAYNRRFERYSPGDLMLQGMVEAAPSLGITRIDLGKGPEHYKRRFMTGAIAVAEGAVETRSPGRALRRAFRRVASLVRASPAVGVARRLRRVARPAENWLRYR